MTAPAPARSVGLDILRALAVLLVLGRHLPEVPADVTPAVRVAFEAWARCGWIGVDLFFVLSGFLVSGLILDEHRRHGRFALGRFLARRGFKIYPAFYVLLLFTIAVKVSTGLELEPGRVLAEALFFQNYREGLWSHTWSLAVEEHFYVLVGLVLLVALRRPSPRFAAAFTTLGVVVLAAVLVARVAHFPAEPYSHLDHLYPTHLRLDSLLFGVILRVGWAPGGWATRVAALPALPLVLGSLAATAPAVALVLEGNAYLHTFGLTVLYLGAGALLLAVLGAQARGTRLLSGAPARVLGAIGARSYSIYLWHVPVMLWGGVALRLLAPGLPHAAGAALLLAASVATGVLAARLVEFPALRIRDRLFPSRTVPVPATVPAPVAGAPA